jgi:hypothetical protein
MEDGRMPKTSKRRGRPSAIAKFSIADIRGEIDRRHADLQARRDDLAAQTAALDAELAELQSLTRSRLNGTGRPKGSRNKVQGGRGARPGRGRGGNERSLPALLQSLLRGKTMSVPDMADAAKKAGHKTKSKNFRTIVSLAILNNQKMFKRVSRGQYTAK